MSWIQRENESRKRNGKLRQIACHESYPGLGAAVSDRIGESSDVALKSQREVARGRRDRSGKAEKGREQHQKSEVRGRKSEDRS